MGHRGGQPIIQRLLTVLEILHVLSAAQLS